MSKFIKPATLTVPKNVFDFLSEVDNYCDENSIYFCDIMENIVNKHTMEPIIDIIYED